MFAILVQVLYFSARILYFLCHLYTISNKRVYFAESWIEEQLAKNYTSK